MIWSAVGIVLAVAAVEHQSTGLAVIAVALTAYAARDW